ncbi:hypothetical protein RhiirA1_453590 [Rhizophagus irregularis]|uniref:RRM domain-containing protein n=1 Tax=Rhizophagus irregularis TaxID=588596 RepID=A0A2N0S750_9GLOM|nr:hypothetical protein RhiirA1_453590 [Rhizophagus irregularis]
MVVVPRVVDPTISRGSSYISTIKADEHARTLVVTDIPLFITDILLRITFSHYSNIVHYHHTCLSKLYRTAYITFESTGALQNLNSSWNIFCLCICLAIFSPDQHAERCVYVTLLAGLPHGTIVGDLAEIADKVSAKLINVLFSMNLYNPKPYAYCHFVSETAVENVKSISYALKNVGLTWHFPDEVTSLCHRCGRPNCNPDRCSSSSHLNHPACLWQSNDKLHALYNKHLPPSHPAKRYNCFAHPDNNNDGQSRGNASHHHFSSRPNNRQPSRFRYQRRLWNRNNLIYNNQHHPIPDVNKLNHYANGIDVIYPCPPTVLTDWKSIGTALEKVVKELALLTTQFSSINSRLSKLKSDMAARTPISESFVTKLPSYIPSSMQGWDDSVNTNNNILVDINSPPLQLTCGFTPIPQFAFILPSNVAPFFPIDMEQ